MVLVGEILVQLIFVLLIRIMFQKKNIEYILFGKIKVNYRKNHSCKLKILLLFHLTLIKINILNNLILTKVTSFWLKIVHLNNTIEHLMRLINMFYTHVSPLKCSIVICMDMAD